MKQHILGKNDLNGFILTNELASGINKNSNLKKLVIYSHSKHNGKLNSKYLIKSEEKTIFTTTKLSKAIKKYNSL